MCSSDLGARQAAALRAVLAVCEHWRCCARIDLNRHRLGRRRIYRWRRGVRRGAIEDELLDRGYLLAVIESLQRD